MLTVEQANENSPDLWRALSDPTRRELLDRLSAGPRTTGDLCSGFAMTRFGVMRHIGVLERAGLEWYRVIAVEPLKSMDLCGQLASRYGGPATSLLHLSLETTSDGVETMLQLTDSVLGRVSPQLTDSVTSGWQAILRDGLKRHIEHGR